MAIIIYIIWSRINLASVGSIIIPTPSLTPTATATPTPTQAPPARMIIPKLNIDTQVEAVSVNTNQTMAVPVSTVTVGWYLHGARPGEAGTAVIAGHYDDPNGQPAVFYSLKQLEVGDQLTMVDLLGKSLVYTVTGKVDFDSASTIDDLAVNDGQKNLALITCSGWWNPAAHNYSHRLVVYATMR